MGMDFFIIKISVFIYILYFRYSNDVWFICEFWGIVINILYFDDEFRFRFKRFVCSFVNSLGMEYIVSFLFFV